MIDAGTSRHSRSRNEYAHRIVSLFRTQHLTSPSPVSQRRAERIDSTRQLDILADLSLGRSDDEADEDDDANGQPDIVREGVGQFATMLPPVAADINPVSSESTQPLAPEIGMQTTQEKKRRKNKRKGKGRAPQQQQHEQEAGALHDSNARPRMAGKSKGKNTKPSKWADKCMYAELLEMKEGGFDASSVVRDGIPEDIESSWVAVTPVPSGKRCLAVTHQTSGIAGIGEWLLVHQFNDSEPAIKNL